ncbi:3-hydroxyacyl-CoA dehydrogenase [Algoriphagus terrigena]|uniref:3-hydroxyacyl-CoA dehydrogenase n=1 Tax=Algoriphagus terrigena TaxID=344884 RepID=UPI0004208623|nr:3-hydroxyacyl-CoA dehydrogenase [Algoriphagus terrigena]
MEIKKICILGAGNLGSRVALQAAVSGLDVSVYDIEQKALDFSQAMMVKLLRPLSRSGQVSSEQEPEILARIQFTLDPNEAARDADLINESVTEDLEIKKKVWRQFGGIAPAKTIFTTNTSYMLASMFAEDSGRPDKFCAFHFHDVFYSRVVDIMPHPGTDPAIISLLEELGRKLNQVPVILKKENPGYLFNTLLLALLGAAAKLLNKEVASIQDIDRAWMVNFHMPMGPFGIMDSVGLDTAWHIISALPDRHSQAFAVLLKGYLDEGKFGEKSGEGFYSYPYPEFKNPDFIC